MDPFIGQIQAYGFNFAPRGWAKCEGQLLAISQYNALFSLLGTQFGGDGRTTFGLPDLRGRVAMGQGAGPGRTARVLGQSGGNEATNLTQANLPAISPKVSSANATQSAATAGASIAAPGSAAGRDFTETLGYNTSAPNIALNAASGGGGNSAAFSNLPPYVVINFFIALEGLYPSRS
jgi:microcystin-dependent protein